MGLSEEEADQLFKFMFKTYVWQIWLMYKNMTPFITNAH